MQFLFEKINMNFSQVALFLVLFVVTNVLKAQEKPFFTSEWDKGYRLSSSDGSFKMKFGGRIQEQWSFVGQDNAMNTLFGEVNNRSELRRIRFYNSGTIYQSVQYKVEFDFANGRATVTDGFIRLTDIPVVGNIQVGHFKEPFSLDMMNSSNDMTFLERAPVSAIKKQRNNGLLLFNTVLDKRATWAMGIYHNTDKTGKSMDEEKFNLTGRVTALPFYEKENNKLLHLGFAYSHRNPSGDEYSLESSAEAHLAPEYVSTGVIVGATSSNMAGGELALLWNSLSFQTEYISSSVQAAAGDFTFSGYSVEAAYFLTGEHKNYSTKVGFFKRVTPNKNFSPKDGNGFGALEVAFRYSNLDLDDEAINGGVLNDYSFGLNWYLNPATRFSVNYTLAQLEDVGNANITQMKFQVAF
tara:strand:+ start:15019 stop:16251 length:1233 start_codon:yes stop_codon:yes gene_type:complete